MKYTVAIIQSILKCLIDSVVIQEKTNKKMKTQWFKQSNAAPTKYYTTQIIYVHALASGCYLNDKKL